MVRVVNQTRRVMLVRAVDICSIEPRYAAYCVTAPARLKITPAMSAP